MIDWAVRAACAGGALSVALGASAGMRIEGISPMQAVHDAPAAVTARAQRLHIALEDGTVLQVAPWPAYLPQRFVAQHVSAARILYPAGPSDRVELRRAGARAPWLLVHTGVHAGQAVVGNWQLERVSGRWRLRNAGAWRSLSLSATTARPTRVRADGAHWCVYLLGSEDPPVTPPGVVQEAEARASLAAVRGKTCN